MARSTFRASAGYLALRHRRRRRCYWRCCSGFSSSVATPQIDRSARAFARVTVRSEATRCKAVARPRPRNRSSNSRSWYRDWIASTTLWFGDCWQRRRRRRQRRCRRRRRRHERRCIFPARHRPCLTIVPSRMRRVRPSTTSSNGYACTSASMRICEWFSKWTRRSSTEPSTLVYPKVVPPWHDRCVPCDRKAGTAPIETNSLCLMFVRIIQLFYLLLLLINVLAFALPSVDSN